MGCLPTSCFIDVPGEHPTHFTGTGKRKVHSMIGQILLNRYEILEKTGEGGMAVVYRARDTLLNRQVAVKVLRSQFATDREFKERFRREAQAAASLSHPNVVNIYDVGDTGRIHFIVMEYVVGRTLHEIIRDESPLAIDHCIDIAHQIAQALAHAHQHHIVHRDIKPHNILITNDGRVKVTDFGIAQALSSANLTQTGMVMGSVHYFSPEQAKGVNVQHFSDLYSLGIVLYEMLTGSVPFKGESPIAVALKQIQDTPASPGNRRSDIPDPLAALVMQLLEKSPSQRGESAGHLASVLMQMRGRSEHPTPVMYDTVTQKIPTAANNDTSAGKEDDMPDKRSQSNTQNKRKSKKSNGKQKRRSLLPVLFLIVLISGLAWTAQYIVPRLLFPAEVQVPNITGLTHNDAQRLLSQYGLRIQLGREVFHDHVAAGAVISQDPSPGRTVREGREIAVQISRGPEYVAMPSVVGLTTREARLQLTQAGFILGEEEAVMDLAAPLNTVVDQEPAANQDVPLGIPVNLYINRGREALGTVAVPDVRGETIDMAEAILEEAGLNMGGTWPEFSTSVDAGRIIEQNPSPGREVEAGWTVDFVYSQGVPTDVSPPVAQQPDSDPGQDPSTPDAPDDETAQWEAGTNWKSVDVTIDVPEGRSQEVVILVIDDFGAREVYREVEVGGARFSQSVQGRGEQAQIQVYIGGRMFLDSTFRELNGS